MNTLFIKIFFSIFSFFTIFYVFSFSKHEIKNNKNKYGGIFVFIYSLIGILLSIYIFWVN